MVQWLSSPANTGNVGFADSIPGSGRSPGEGKSSPLQSFSLESSMDRGAWQAKVTNSRTLLSRMHAHMHGEIVPLENHSNNCYRHDLLVNATWKLLKEK